MERYESCITAHPKVISDKLSTALLVETFICDDLYLSNTQWHQPNLLYATN